MSRAANRILRVLRESGPRPLPIIKGLAGGTQEALQRAVGELFISGSVVWKGKTKGRRLAARTA